MNKKKSKFPYLIGFSALLVAFASAFFSVFGLSQLFAGAKIQVIFMAGSLEFAKLVLASFLYRYWIKVNKAMKFYMSLAIFVLMAITSLGIYGYLSAAYQDTATKYEKRGNEIATFNQKKALDSLDAARLQDRYNKLTDLRKSQETRLDTLYNRRQNTTAKRTEDLINKTNLEISQLDSLIRTKNDKVTEINSEILTLNSENISGEIGPLKYISDLTGLPMNKVVNIFILLLIFVFDPLAVTMIVGANLAFKQNEGIGDNEHHHEEPISKMWSWAKRKQKNISPVDDIDLKIIDENISNEELELLESDGQEILINDEPEIPINDKQEILINDEQEKLIKEQVLNPIIESNIEVFNTANTEKNIEQNEIEKQTFIATSIDSDNEDIFDSVNIEQMFDEAEKQIQEYENSKNEIVQQENLIDNKNKVDDSKEKTNESNNLNIYGEHIPLTQPPKSEYTPGGGISWTPD